MQTKFLRLNLVRLREDNCSILHMFFKETHVRLSAGINLQTAQLSAAVWEARMTFGMPVDPEVKSTFPEVSVERILPNERMVSEGSTNLPSVRICPPQNRYSLYVRVYSILS